MKANPDERLIATLAQLGSCFDVASDGEMRFLSAMGVVGDRNGVCQPSENKWRVRGGKRNWCPEVYV